MAKRKDGEQTRDRLLEAASMEFTEKGFHGAKVAQICRRAGCNVAAINYYFGSKDELYLAVFRQAIENSTGSWQVADTGLRPEDRLRQVITAIIGEHLQCGDSGQFLRLYLMELAHPTGLIDDTLRHYFEPRRHETLALLAELLGPGASRQDVLFCEMSVINQCRGFMMMSDGKLEWLMERKKSPELAAAVADHVFRFSMAGIRAVAERCGA